MRHRLLLAPALLTVSSLVAFAQQPSTGLSAAGEHLQRGRYDEALEAYEAIKEPKEAAQAAVGISRVHEARGDLDKAEQSLTEAAAKSKADAALLARLAEVQLARGKYAEAEKSVQQSLKLSPELPLAQLVQADLFAATGRLQQADEGYRWFVRYYNKAQPEDAKTLLLIAKGAAQYARWNRASRIFDFIVNTLSPDALKNDKNCWQAYWISGSLFLEKYNRADALSEFKQALAINPQAAEVHTALALDSLQEHDLDEAARHVKRALEINPKLIDALQIQADLKLEDSQPAEALKILETARALHPHDEETLARIGVCYILMDGPPADDELADVFLRLESADKIALTNPSRFLQLLVEAARVNPHPGVFLTQVGEAVEARRKYDLAERFFRQAIVSMPKLADPKTALGMLYLRVGKNAEARKILDEAFKQDPFHFRVSNMIKVLKVLDTYNAVETEHFIVRVDSKLDRLFGRYAAEYLEEVYPGLVRQFGYEPPGKTQFEVYNKSKGLSGHEWFSARMVGLPWIQTVGASTGKIVALASPTEGTRSFNWARVLKHEFVHVVTLQQTNFNIPHWYTEALAVMNEGYPRPPQWDDLLLERVPKGQLMNLDNLNQGFIRPKSADDWQFAYCQSLLYAQYMTETYGQDTISKLLDAYKLNLMTTDAIQRATGVDKATFEKGYREYLDKIVKDLRGGQFEEPAKLADLEKAHLKDPENPQAAGRYAYELYKAKKPKQARELATKAREKDPKNPHASLVIAALALRSEDTDEAMTVLTEAVDREKPNLEVVETLAALRLKAGDSTEALELYELGLKVRPRSKDLLKGLASSAAKSGDREKLRATLRTLVDLDPDEGAYPKKLADLALDDEAWDEAVRYGRGALYVDVMDAEVHVTLAKAFAGLQKTDKCIEEWKVAVELKPDEPDFAVGLARAESAAGQKETARKRVEEVLKKHPTHAEAKALAEEL